MCYSHTCNNEKMLSVTLNRYVHKLLLLYKKVNCALTHSKTPDTKSKNVLHRTFLFSAHT